MAALAICTPFKPCHRCLIILGQTSSQLGLFNGHLKVLLRVDKFFLIQSVFCVYNCMGCHNNQFNDIQHNDTQYNDSQHTDTQDNETQHYDTWHNETQHNGTRHTDTRHNTLSITTICIMQSAQRHSA